MEYRVHPRTGQKISVIGFGTASICNAKESDAIETMQYAVENGINYFDFATGGAKTFGYAGKALAPYRKDLIYQVHFGADYSKGEYGWTTNLDKIKEQVEWQLKQLGTDYIDFGFIHCLDELSDWESYQKSGALDYLLSMKKAGVVKNIGLSSHTPELVNAVLDSGLVDQLMFSINPAYDYHQGEYANGSSEERMALYKRCEAEGVGISVMKPYSAGQLLSDKTSPFYKALTKAQCIQYALDKPGVLTVLPGSNSIQELKETLCYVTASDEEKDYSVLGTFTPAEAKGTCVYCNHCAPCPMGLNIGLINKFYDLAKIGDAMAKEHYEALDKNASDCIGCGHCDKRCPFRVHQSERMKEIAAYFGK